MDHFQCMLSPGNALKAIYNINVHGESGTFADGNIVVLRIFAGGHVVWHKVDHRSLNEVSPGRAMDTIFGNDLELMYYDIVSRAKVQY